MNPLPNLTRRYWRFPKHMTSLEIEVHVDAPLAVPKFHFTRSSISNGVQIDILTALKLRKAKGLPCLKLHHSIVQ